MRFLGCGDVYLCKKQKNRYLVCRFWVSKRLFAFVLSFAIVGLCCQPVFDAFVYLFIRQFNRIGTLCLLCGDLLWRSTLLVRSSKDITPENASV